MKLNITPGPWYAEGKGVYEIEGFEVASCSSYVIDHKILNDNQIALVTAVNNTYHKGINPEAVPEMLEVAKELREWYEKNHQRWFGEHTPIPFSKLLSILQKATL